MSHHTQKNETLPWIEKYRPNDLGGLISHSHIKATLKRFIDNKFLPHLLFYGPPGTGKTSTIMACARELYGKYMHLMVMELNASDDRGIEVVRNKIKQFVSSGNAFYGTTVEEKDNIFKLVILDETDAMTDDAQAILRQVVEKYTHNARFCLICNYIKKINPALQSRCTSFRFSPLQVDQMKIKLDSIVDNENLNITKKGMRCVLKRANGDMRRALNILQSTNMAYKKITEKNVNYCIGYPQKEQMDKIYNSLMNESFKNSYNTISEMKSEYGISIKDIIDEIHEIIINNIMTKKDKRDIDILIRLKDLEYNIASTSNDSIQLSGLVAIFNF
ncbi:MAG: replication factor C small subunit [Magnetococcales bacterium]|nr:replication factor C small subunit [Magnetococcales bacterium]|tara:strand:+ start:25221 stop:26216 length:996 start_codon:yes stop_codon:yes gene_type:complete